MFLPITNNGMITNKKQLLPYQSFSQIHLDLPMDGCQCGYTTKVKKP
jgi:hypothetical protein